METYLRKRLDSAIEEAVSKNIRALLELRRELARNNSLQRVTSGEKISEAVIQHFRTDTSAVSKFVFEVCDGDTLLGANFVSDTAQKIASRLVEEISKIYRNSASLGNESAKQQFINDLDKRLEKECIRLSADFSNAVLGDTKMKKDPFIKVVSTITNSPGATQQSGVGNFNQSGIQQQFGELQHTLNDLIRSDEFKALNERQQHSLRDVIDVILIETGKPVAERSKVTRWLERLKELSIEFGLHSAAHTMGAILAKLLAV